MKVFVSGYWNQNLGDDLFLALLCRRYPKDDFYVIAGSSAMESFHDLANLHQVHLPLSVKLAYHLKQHLGWQENLSILQKEQIKVALQCDLYCELGGSLFIEPRAGMDQQFTMRQKIADSGTPYIIMGSNFGPFYQQSQLNHYKLLFAQMQRIWLRDHHSLNLFQDLTKVSYAPDLAFAWPTDHLSISDNGYVLISVIDVAKRFGESVNRQYQESLLCSIRSFLNEKRPVYLMSFCENDGDLKAAQVLKSQIDSPLIKVINHTNVEQSIQIIAHAHQVIATRYHSMILAWLLNKPTVVLSYSHKIDYVISDLYPQQTCLEINKLDSDLDLSRLRYNQPDSIKKIIQQTRRQLDDFDEYFHY